MPTVHITCGKICSGKSYLARELREFNEDTENAYQKAIILSVDDIMRIIITANGGCLGERHRAVERQVLEYILERAIDIIAIIALNAAVIIDHGFWYNDDRAYTQSYFKAREISPIWHYCDEEYEIRKARLTERNKIAPENAINPDKLRGFDQLFEDLDF